jgi:AhpD family alkylhydroperoxidase
MQARMQSPALTLPGALDALRQLARCAEQAGLSRSLQELCNLRASQINGCAVCVEMHSRALAKLGEPQERIFALAAWREAPYYSDAERAALALSEATTRISDRADPVSDEIWQDAVRHFEPPVLAALVLSIATVNVWNRLNAATKQIGGAWTAQYI